MTKKTQLQYNTILSFMKPETWYKASEFEDVLGVKETRVKELLRRLIAEGKIVDNGVTKGKIYKKVK